MRLLLVQALWATAASSRGWSEVRVLENVGVVVRPRAKPSSGRGPMLRRLRREGVNRVRLLSYGAREIGDAVGALGASAKITVTVPDAEVEAVGRDAGAARRACLAFAPAVLAGNVDLVVVGVTPPSGVGADAWRLTSLANATRNVAGECANMNATVRVSTAFSLNVLRSSFPPSASLFAAPGPLAPILAQLRRTKSPFVIEIDPYLAWRQSYYDISLAFALFDLGPESPPQFVDAGSGSSYRNLFDAMLDAVRWALYAEGYGDLDIVVGKVGWPSGPAARPGAGDAADDSDGATVENAALFNSRLAAHMGGPVGAWERDVVVAFVYEADDAPPPAAGGPDPNYGLRWGVCGASGALKYSLRNGAVLAPRLKTGCWGLGCLGDARAALSLQLVLAACASALLLGAVAFGVAWLSVFPRRTFKRHSPTRVAAIVRAANFKAEENLRDERSRRARNSNGGHAASGNPFGFLDQRPPRPLSTVAESPLTSDVDEADWGLRPSRRPESSQSSLSPDDERKQTPRTPRFAELDSAH